MNVDRAVDEVRALAAELGLRAEPVVLADRSNLVLRLDDVVARVAMATSMVRVGMAWLRREVELSEYLASRNANVTRPSARVAPGPHDRHGFVISFWELEIILADRADPIASGQELANAHRCLVDYPVDKLQRWGGFEEASEIFVRTRTSPFFTQDDRRVLERAWDTAAQIVETAHERSASMQAVHGDAHLNNVLATARGAVWTDWEDAFWGPVEWDLACLRSRAELLGEDRETIDAMTDAYDGPWNAELARDLQLVRNLQVIVWTAVFAERHPDLLPRMRARLARLPPLVDR